MKLRENRVKIKCDQCNKETEWEVIEQASVKVPDIMSGWILGYNITGDPMNNVDDQDYCSVKCLHEGIDDYFKQFTVRKKNNKGGGVNV